MTGSIKLLLADDHSLFRRGLMAILASDEQFKVVGEAVNGIEAIRATKDLKPDVVLMDLEMPLCNGIEATRSIREEGFCGGILILTISECRNDLLATIKAGATGYLLKEAEPEELKFAITHIAHAGTIISPRMAGMLLEEFRTSPNQTDGRSNAESGLSPRENEVLELVAKGESNKEIADQLFISENTVKDHLKNILSKLHLKNRSQVAIYAVEKGMTKLR